MKKIRSFLFLIALFLMVGAAAVPAQKAKALSDGEDIGSVSVTFCGTQLFYQGTDVPDAKFLAAEVYPADGGPYVLVWNPGFDTPPMLVSGSFDVGTQIGWVLYVWGTSDLQNTYVEYVYTASCPTGVPLIQEWVYYSANPFFGNTHTLTLYSALGIPSELSVKYWAGGAFPEGFDYKKGPACTAILYDDGTDQGAFACDGFLKSVYERRAWLRNDPDGSKFDMEPKLESYFKMLKANGETPQQLP